GGASPLGRAAPGRGRRRGARHRGALRRPRAREGVTMNLSARRPDVDWLRVTATWLLFVFHAAKVFDPAPFFHIRHTETSLGMLVLAGFIGLWHMPLFFVLAGWSIPASLGARGTAGFLRERVARLVVPLVAGTLCFGPIMKYLELRSGLELTATGLRVSPALQESFALWCPQ